MIEASAVLPEGRISPEDMVRSEASSPGDLTVYRESGPTSTYQAHHGKIGIQLSHAGRKASQVAPWIKEQARDDGWKGGRVASAENGGWGDKGQPLRPL
jgi:2,4-dienoyl-CoA reductase-like NADH-dependent reductase (Old Yellow Enzyme family)